MKEHQIKLVIGSLLHDIGKIVYHPCKDGQKHGSSGYAYLKEEIKLEDQEILDCVRYHHAEALDKAELPQSALAYIVCFANRIAAATEYREKVQSESGFEIHTAMQPVFNILNGNHKNMYYRPGTLDPDSEINFPIEEKKKFDEQQYKQIQKSISTHLKGLEWKAREINSLLEILEENLSFIPSSSAEEGIADISLYDHLKLTAAIASCIDAWLEERQIEDYQRELVQQEEDFYHKKVFLLASMDISGIQNFIYTIATKNALKTLRSRSFYLEVMMEHILDTLLEKMELSRANLIYSGGGHCYMLLPNTDKGKRFFNEYVDELNKWCREKFQIALYIAGGYVECSANELHNQPQGSYGELFRQLSSILSEKKSKRYTAEEILWLNRSEMKRYDRECKVCKRIDQVNENGVCSLCEAFEIFSKEVLKSSIFTVISGEKEKGLPLPGGYALIADTEERLQSREETEAQFVRVYGKNKECRGKHISARLWVGDYASQSSFKELAKAAEGIERIAVLRADVDNLGKAIVSGFAAEGSPDQYVSLSRTATLSRQLSLFFKFYINRILSTPEYQLFHTRKEDRNAAIVYSGGDDLFIVGAWDDVIELAVDVRRSFERYTENTLTISAGIGIYSPAYPISVIAEEVAGLEDKSKQKAEKNSVTLLEDGADHEETVNGSKVRISDGTYSWQEFEEEVIEEKYRVIQNFFEECDTRGKAFLYRLLELVRGQEEKINFARFVYLIARLEPGQEASGKQKKLYHEFSQSMYRWLSEEDREKRSKNCRQLKTAFSLYIYYTREKEEE